MELIKLINLLKESIIKYGDEYKPDKLTLNDVNLLNCTEELLIKTIRIKHRITRESGIDKYYLFLSKSQEYTCQIYYKEYEHCCGKAILYGLANIKNPNANIKHEPFKFLMNLTFACIKINKYSFIDYVVSQWEQRKLFDLVLADKDLYDSYTIFNNERTDHICANFCKDLKDFLVK